jgi:hypothetical protein
MFVLILLLLLLASPAMADKAYFILPCDNHIVDIPPMNCSEVGCLQLTYEENGQPKGGFARVSPDAPTVMMLVWSSKEVIDAMKANPKYIWVEDIVEVADETP